MKGIPCLALTALLLALSLVPGRAERRGLPVPLPAHPGNIFLAGERVSIPAPAQAGAGWEATDYEGRTVLQGESVAGQADLGRLPVGYYEVHWAGITQAVSAGVLAQLRAATPLTSPICSDIAMAWLVPGPKMPALANLAALAGINWVRDRLNWPELQPVRGAAITSNRYDFSINSQAAAGLQVLDVTHISPAWANPTAKRFPLDLRDAYEYHRTLAIRWRGVVGAFEPWNEADIDVFGGHTGSEMASLQKAAYLGLKAGNPKVIACLNVFAIHRPSTLEDFAANQAWPYFDTFNLHHYEPFTNYSRLYADFRSVSAGRPLWVSECSLPVKWHGNPQLQEPTQADLLVQSERVAVTYALSLYEGAQAVFYFILPHFVEGPTQFGLLRPDLTPRPAFVALAAAGRLLADARALGKYTQASEGISAYVFESKPDGKKAHMLVAWSDAPAELALPRPPRACFDHLGREVPVNSNTIPINRAPVFIWLAPGTDLPLQPPPTAPKRSPGQPCPVVLQAVLPESCVLLEKSAYKIIGPNLTIPLYAYNFGSKKLRGVLDCAASVGWSVDCDREIELSPGDRKPITVTVTRANPQSEEGIIRFAGDFFRAGRAVLSLRVIVRPASGSGA